MSIKKGERYLARFLFCAAVLLPQYGIAAPVGLPKDGTGTSYPIVADAGGGFYVMDKGNGFYQICGNNQCTRRSLEPYRDQIAAYEAAKNKNSQTSGKTTSSSPTQQQHTALQITPSSTSCSTCNSGGGTAGASKCSSCSRGDTSADGEDSGGGCTSCDGAGGNGSGGGNLLGAGKGLAGPIAAGAAGGLFNGQNNQQVPTPVPTAVPTQTPRPSNTPVGSKGVDASTTGKTGEFGIVVIK